jgi:hypothetical protein
MTVSWRRSAVPLVRGGGGAVAVIADLAGVAISFWPHSKQNFAPAGLALPHDGHRAGSAAPQQMQNLLLSGVPEWQLGHSMSAPSDASSSTVPDLPWRGK